jgi:hypothetical protein
MNKTFAALTAATVAFAAFSVPAEAGGRGGAVAAGVIGGLAAGAIIGGAIANSGPAYYAPPPPPRVPYYVEPAPAYVVDEPVCRVERRRYWDGYGYRLRRVEVCD